MAYFWQKPKVYDFVDGKWMVVVNSAAVWAYLEFEKQYPGAVEGLNKLVGVAEGVTGLALPGISAPVVAGLVVAGAMLAKRWAFPKLSQPEGEEEPVEVS